jgi:DNA-binding CsgD family transcriptional regulator
LPLLVVVALRPPETSREPELLTEIVSDPAAVVLRPGALGLESAATLARSVFTAEPDPAFVSACHAATGGNPLFLQSLLDTLRAEGVPPTAAYASQVVEIGPESVSRAVALRLSRLPSEANLLARAVAVLGDGAALHHAAALADLDREVASHAATTLARSDVLRFEMPLEFVHPVVRTAVYDDLAPSERMAAHRRAAEILQIGGAEPEQVACHLVITTPSRDPFVVRTLREAARLAVRRGSPDTAIAYLQRALDEPAEGQDRTAILVQLGMVERRVDTAAATEHFAAAIDDIEDPIRRVEIAVEFGRCLFRLSRNEEALRVFTSAIEWLGDAKGDLRQLLEAELIGAAWFDAELNHVAEQRIVCVREDELEGEVGRAVMLATLRYYDARRGVDRERVRTLDDAALVRALISSGGAPALYYASFTLTVAGMAEESRRFLRVAIDMAKERGDLVLLGGMLIFSGFLEAQRGDLSGAEEDLRAALELGAFHRRQQVLAYYVPWITDVLVERGELERAETELARLGLGEQVPANAHLFFFLSSRARLRLARREPERALSDLELLGSYMDSFHVRNPAFVPWRSQLAETLIALDRGREALSLAREEVELARGWGAPRALGVALRVRGLAEGGKAGLASLREAVEVLEESPAQLELARALVDLGAALRRANQRSESRDYLRRGLELAHRLGARPLEDHAQAELAATGARPRRLALSGVDALTPSERRVAEMAAENMTNKDIAQALFVTPKTVEVHLSSVYRKLQIASRAQLPGALVPAA